MNLLMLSISAQVQRSDMLRPLSNVLLQLLFHHRFHTPILVILVSALELGFGLRHLLLEESCLRGHLGS
jgi:hypothetical protein